MEQKVQQQAADTLLERGVRFTIPAPFLLRVIGKKEIGFTIYPSKAGTLIAMSSRYLSMGIDTTGLDAGDVTEAYRLVSLHGKYIASTVAMAVFNSKWSIRLFSALLGRYLLWKLPAKRLYELLVIVTMQGGLKDFMNIIRLLPAVNMMKRNLSQEEKGS